MYSTIYLILSNFNETWIFWPIVDKCSNIEFLENLASGRPIVPCEQREADGGRDVTNLVVARRNFANAPKDSSFFFCGTIWRVSFDAVRAVG